MHFLGTRLLLFSGFTQASQVFPRTPLDNICKLGEKGTLLERTQAILEDNQGVCGSSNKQFESKVHNPWTQKPICMPQTSSNQTYCVYTHKNHANGRGITFLTSPDVERTLANEPYFAQKFPPHVNNFSNPPYEVRNVPGRGNGLYATRQIELGEVIVAETPVGIFQSDAFPHDKALKYQYINAAFKSLPSETQEAFMKMAAMHGGKEDEITERIHTNSFHGEFAGLEHFMVFPQTAFMNHDCRPNGMYFFDPNTLIKSTHAARTILPGEELTINYISLLRLHKERQEHLLDVWGFKCTCDLCSASQGKIQISDFRIQQIRYIHDGLADWSASSYATIAMAEWLIELYEEEHLWASRPISYVFAALAYNGVGDAEKARAFAIKSLETGMINRGVNKEMGPGNNNDIADMQAIIKDPKSHWTWMARPPKV
ncbi:hypothetical protein HYALB_00010313 [Hymenoscyphus albidus]|uniref:SET domain-containing protein n=1 Tax=Hymenoscyphus albidus TaxID=595503 RepID=A0A9N9LXL2_9HELO|nr:hypothetical protein HYALB_00010313 [Hymenoscyphus albidus]